MNYYIIGIITPYVFEGLERGNTKNEFYVLCKITCGITPTQNK